LEVETKIQLSPLLSARINFNRRFFLGMAQILTRHPNFKRKSSVFMLRFKNMKLLIM